MPCVPKASELLAPMLMMILPSGGAPLRMFGAASPAANAGPAAKKLRRVGIDQFPFEDGIAEHVDKGQASTSSFARTPRAGRGPRSSAHRQSGLPLRRSPSYR